MQTSLSLSLDKRRTRKDGSYPIILRLGHFQRTTSIATGYSVREEFWDRKKKEVKRSFKGVSSVANLNKSLLKELAKAKEVIVRLDDKGELDHLSLKQVKDRITGATNYSSFFDYTSMKIIELKSVNRYGTARSYKGVLQVLKKYTNGNELRFHEINYQFLKGFEQYHLSKGNGLNSLSTYFRALRAIYNKAIKEGHADKDPHPFTNYSIKSVPTEKRAIDIVYIKKILELKLPENSTLFHYRNYFISSYMLYGMSFVDLAHLKLENLKDGRIMFRRKKTSKLYDIKIKEQLIKVLDFYLPKKKKSDYVFPIIKREDPELIERDINWERKRYNKGLKEIARLCGIQQRLTSYVPRHSFATQAMIQEVPLQAISAMLGHSKLNTTQIYLKSLPNNILDSYNERLDIS
ncbi:site-specific integrase [Flagellimonas sp. 2504JD1-5]